MQQQQYERFASGPSFQPIATPELSRAMGAENAVLEEGQRIRQNSEADHVKTQLLDAIFQADGLDKLAGFSETLAQAMVERQEKLNEQQQEQGLRDAYVNGVPPDIMQEYNNQMQELNSSGASTERGLNNAVESNQIPWRLARELSSMSPHMRVGYTKGILKQLNQTYPQLLQTELLEELRQNPSMSLEEKTQRMQAYRYNWMMRSGLGNINPAMLNAELFPKMKEAEASVVNQWRIQEE